MRIWIATVICLFILGKAVSLRNAQVTEENRVYAPRTLKFEVRELPGRVCEIKAIDESTGEVQMRCVPASEKAETLALNREQ
jgi:hypothetical protein